MRTTVRLKSDHGEKLLARLIADAESAPESTSAARLWAAAYSAVQDPLKSLFEEVEKDFPAKVRTSEHWAVFVDRLEDESEHVAHVLTWGKPSRRRKRSGRLQRFSSRNGWTMRSGFEIWSVEGNAIREALLHLQIDLRFPRKDLPKDIIGVCHVCWRTAAPSPRGMFYCEEHGKFGRAYKHALARRLWRDPSQPEEIRKSFVWHWAIERREQLPYALWAEPQDLSALAAICRGEDRSLDLEPDWRVPIQDYWGVFPRTLSYLKRHPSRVNITDVDSVLSALDPVVTGLAAVQKRMHLLMAADHRLFFDRLVYVEACLEADARRRRNRGPKARQVERPGQIVVPYTFSYSGAGSASLI